MINAADCEAVSFDARSPTRYEAHQKGRFITVSLRERSISKYHAETSYQ